MPRATSGEHDPRDEHHGRRDEKAGEEDGQPSRDDEWQRSRMRDAVRAFALGVEAGGDDELAPAGALEESSAEHDHPLHR